LAAEVRPDITILEINLPGLNGIDTTRRLLQTHPSMSVIAISVSADWEAVAGIMEAGASGYVLADGGVEELGVAIENCEKGLVYMSPRAENVVIRSLDRFTSPTRTKILTHREREVLQTLAEGKSTREAAAALGVSTKTIETHRRRIMEKLGIHSIAGLVKYAIRHGITSVN
jgi:DNA-binding NarL/FixJ family response regulator